MREEHFGMAPAEMARAGCIVWVPRGGGQMEIVGREPALMYESDDEAVEKISATLGERIASKQRCATLWRRQPSGSRPSGFRAAGPAIDRRRRSASELNDAPIR